MTREFDDSMTQRVDEQSERLVVRYLDGACTPQEQAQVERLIETDAAVAALFAEYQQIDLLSRDALSTVLVTPSVCREAAAGLATDDREATGFASVRVSQWLSWRDALAGLGVMAAAAALAFWFIPAQRSNVVPNGVQQPVLVERAAEMPEATFVADRAFNADEARSQWMPHQQQVDTQRDVMGVFHPGTNRMYLIGLDRQAVRTTPVVYSD